MSNAASSTRESVFPTFQKLFPNAHNDWQRVIAESELPLDVQQLICGVVKKTRLLRNEKSEVATELISHFQDGYFRGQTYLKLVEDFGDPSVTATLIRRSKVRNRSMLIKIVKGVGYGGAGCSAAYLLALAFFHLGKTNPTIDYLVDFNRGIANVKEADKAWPVYRPLWIKYGFSEGGECRFEEMYTTDSTGEQRLAKPEDENWPQTVEMLKHYDDLLQTFRTGSRLPALGLELQANARNYSDEDFTALFPGRDKKQFDQWIDDNWDENSRRIMKNSLVGILLPHIQSFRKAARVFHVDTRLAVVQGDSERAVQNIETVFGLANQAAQPQCLVCGLVGIAISSIGFEQLEEVINADRDFFSEKQLARLQNAVEAMPIKSWIRYEGERASIKDMIQRAYTDDGQGDGRMTADGVELMFLVSKWFAMNQAQSDLDVYLETARPAFGPASLFLCATRKEITEKTDELIDNVIADADLPYWVSGGVDFDADLEENRIKYWLLSVMFPASEQIKNAAYRTIGRQEGVIAALAIHRYHKKHGQWPTQINQVSPVFVNEFPIDQVDGSLVKFNCDGDVVKVYSVGRDHDDDDGTVVDDGRPLANFVFGPKSPEVDGDWILWPQHPVQVESPVK